MTILTDKEIRESKKCRQFKIPQLGTDPNGCGGRNAWARHWLTAGGNQPAKCTIKEVACAYAGKHGTNRH
jgi:hypothetical protein